MKKVIPIIIVIAVISVLFAGKYFFAETSIERVERITGYDLPDKMKELYHFQDDTFSGVACQYSVYSLDDEPQCIKENPIDNRVFALSSGETTLLYQNPKDSGKSLFALTESEEMSFIRNLEVFEIPQKYIPDFEQPYTYTTGNEGTYIVYFPEQDRLVIWVSGH